MTDFVFNKNLLDRNGSFEFYFGIWNPSGLKQFDFDAFINYPGITVSRGKKHFLASSIFTVNSKSLSLITSFNEDNNNTTELLFRGYILDPPIHSLSPREEIADYWKHDLCRNHNGVFSAVAIKNAEDTLVMTTDAFGIGTLYYRRLGTSVVFSSSPRFLSYENDLPNLKAWRCLMESGFIMGDRSLNKEIRRVPPGTILSFSEGKYLKKTWFDYSKLPEGRDLITPVAADGVEYAFSNAIKRCLRLNTDERLLPLSSGYDSRHILAHLLLNNVSFKSATVRVPISAKGYDLDGYFSETLVKKYGLTHSFHEMPAGEDWFRADNCRRFILDYESPVPMHTWYLPVWDIPYKSTVVLDGLCGDTLSHSGLKISGIGGNYVPKRKIIAQHLVKQKLGPIFNHKFWPDKKEVFNDFMEGVGFIPETPVLVDIMVMLHRARRSVSIASQQFSKPGHIAVYPYMDMDYVYTLLRYHPLERFKTPFQAQCLMRYHSSIYNHYGSHNIPAGLPIPVINNDQIFSSDYLKSLKVLSDTSSQLKFLNWKRRFMLKLAERQKISVRHIAWWVSPFLEYMDQRRQPSFIMKQ